MLGRIAPAAALAAVLAVGAAAPARAEDPAPAYPSSMAALGDSITRGFNACGWFFDCTARSWSTGDSDRVNGHYHRLTTLNPGLEGNRHNNAETGANSADLVAQAFDAVEQRVDYVTVLIGANDACADTEAGMTSAIQYRTNVSAALDAIKEGLPDARVFIASIPDVYRVWEAGKDNPDARNTWELAGICQSLLADPLSTDAAAEQRRANVRQRVVDYNTAASELCAAYGPNCSYDGNAVFGTQLTADDISAWDFFHPNVEGQARIAEVTFAAAFGTEPSPST
ncbi:lipoprotein [Actinorhabdospora filicis]|uniref:Lipoprotein n=1 Tax=Actinorhabdospora filicis TaxID=1785913 RepID=A0A9W6SNJ2_9ACTN|nr:GDSL-type esterase/lipase family protein [Actinorhabdospora filicis]GLZ79134.1 lipoprotein [Actinorhabdospora filicis]